jgi:hypothetical protein
MMPGLPDWAALAAFVAAAAVVVALLAARRGRGAPPVSAKPFLTGNEREFLGRLERALPEARIHAQVAMGALLQPSVRGGGREANRHRLSVRARFDRKIVDYVVEDRRSGRILALVELDDRTHDRRRDKARDAMTARAGYRTVRFESRAKPDAAGIRAAVLDGAR